MIYTAEENIYNLRTDADKNAQGSLTLEDEQTKEDETGGGELLLCRECLHVVTSKAERIAVDGSHSHSFANPHGIFFEIGCFRNARGCGHSSEASFEFTWFRGFNWRVAVCRGCFNHIGWLFSSSGSRFYGLILDQLIESEEGQ